MGRHIELIARGVCVKGGKLLLCHCKGAANTYLPGGHIEFGERAPDSLCREILEEMGLAAKAGRFLGAVEHTFRQKGQRKCEVNLVFELRIPAIDPRQAPPSEEDHIEFLWVPVSRLAKSGLEPSLLRRLIPAWVKQTNRVECWGSSYDVPRKRPA